MKKLILTAIAAASMAAANAQKVADTVYLTPGYAKQVWYSLPNDEQGSAPKNEWDIAFDASGYGSTIMINSVTGTMLWKYPKNDLSGWATVDTTGLSTWSPCYNSDTSWAYGAMGRYSDPSNPFDLDWGTYSLTTHAVTGDSIYIIRLSTGDYKKLAIESLAGSVYTFKYENLDGSSPVATTLDKSSYTGKNFAYYSLQTDKGIDREPASNNWDLVFTQYTTFIPQAYTVTGVLTNSGVTAAQCANVIGKDTFVTWKPETFYREMNTIGYDWKTFTGSAYKVQDSLVYFVARKNGEIWKMIFTDFGGSSTGGFMFTKEKLYTPPVTTGATNTAVPTTGIAAYPNPAMNGQATVVVYNHEMSTSNTTLSVYDMSGRLIHTAALDNAQGLHQYVLPAGMLNSGMYVVNITTANSSAQHKLIVQ